MKHKKDYYKILNVMPAATSAEIRQVYRQLAIFKHPDRDPSPRATAEMQEINEAYSILGNENKRMRYDFEYTNTASVPRKNSYRTRQNTKVTGKPQDFLKQFIDAVKIIFVSLVIIELMLLLSGVLISLGVFS